jgi:sporadic carbohydrate cluster protein (TIGR04323 family)
MEYLLSATEYAMAGSYLMLQNVLADLSEMEGIVCYSLFQLPYDNSKRCQVYDAVLTANKQIHFSLESLAVTRVEEVDRIEDIWKVSKMLPDTLSVGDLKKVITV